MSFNGGASRTYEAVLGAEISRVEHDELGREIVVAMILAIQERLSRDPRQKIYPYASSLELIMRACAAALEHGSPHAPVDDHAQVEHIKSKLENGVALLLHDIGVRNNDQLF